MSPDIAAEIAAHLNPNIGAFHRIPNGLPVYTQIDIAWALGLIKIERHRLWIRVAYAHHLDFYPDLKRLILTDIVNQYHHEKWYIERPGLLGDMIDTAVLEVLQAPICGTCRGQGSRQINDKFISCPKCLGTGIKRTSDFWRASSCQIHRQQWKRSWRHRYNQILDIVRGLDGTAKDIFAHRLQV